MDKNKNTILYNYNDLSNLITKIGTKSAFAVCGRHTIGTDIDKYLSSLPIKIEKYFDVKENPTYESIQIAADKFSKGEYDLLISVGGGSVMDTAKGIKYYCSNNFEINIPHIAIPTTAGSGSEATRFSVMYHNGIKQTLDHVALLPEYSVLDARLLYSLNDNQKKIPLLDALCQCIESLLSISTTNESREYSEKGIELIVDNYKPYITGDKSVYDDIFIASNYSGRAINITKTNIGHSMSYQLTSKFGVKHGQAVALCLISALRFIENKYGESNTSLFEELAKVLKCEKNQKPSDKLMQIYNDMELPDPLKEYTIIPEELSEGVDIERLGNFVFKLSKHDLVDIYKMLKCY